MQSSEELQVLADAHTEALGAACRAVQERQQNLRAAFTSSRQVDFAQSAEPFMDVVEERLAEALGDAISLVENYLGATNRLADALQPDTDAEAEQAEPRLAAAMAGDSLLLETLCAAMAPEETRMLDARAGVVAPSLMGSSIDRRLDGDLAEIDQGVHGASPATPRRAVRSDLDIEAAVDGVIDPSAKNINKIVGAAVPFGLGHLGSGVGHLASGVLGTAGKAPGKARRVLRELLDAVVRKLRQLLPDNWFGRALERVLDLLKESFTEMVLRAAYQVDTLVEHCEEFVEELRQKADPSIGRRGKVVAAIPDHAEDQLKWIKWGLRAFRAATAIGLVVSAGLALPVCFAVLAGLALWALWVVESNLGWGLLTPKLLTPRPSSLYANAAT
ncbi:MAG TPA: hypothetical protein VGP46_06470 [Acidimicrobiales bacterium]|jgi:hypothetical protein|nr:hypothetical protein [Acidimicrobiales bacterium]